MTHPEEPPGPPPPPSQPPPPRYPTAAPPPTEVVEWGARAPRGSFLLGRWGDRHLPVARPLAGLGAAALFASTIGDWELTSRRLSSSADPESPFFVDEPVEMAMGVDTVGAYGMVWLIGAVGLAICVWLTLFGLPGIRAYARSVGVATAGVLLGLLAAATVSASTDVTETIDLSVEMVEQHRPGWGLFVAFAGAVLLGAAAWLARVPAIPARAGDSAPPPPAPTAPGPPAPGLTAPGPTAPGPPGRAVPGPTAPGQAVPGQAVPVAGPEFEGPADLAVGPAEPFARPDDDRRWR